MKIVDCPGCRARLSSEARQCPYCGALLEGIPSGGLRARTRNSPARTAGCILGILVFLALVALMALAGNLKACRQLSPFHEALEQRQGK